MIFPLPPLDPAMLALLSFSQISLTFFSNIFDFFTFCFCFSESVWSASFAILRSPSGLKPSYFAVLNIVFFRYTVYSDCLPSWKCLPLNSIKTLKFSRLPVLCIFIAIFFLFSFCFWKNVLIANFQNTKCLFIWICTSLLLWLYLKNNLSWC